MCCAKIKLFLIYVIIKGNANKTFEESLNLALKCLILQHTVHGPPQL